VAQKTRFVIYAMQQQQPSELLQVLLQHKGNGVSEKDSLGKTALIYAVCNNDVAMVHQLFTASVRPKDMPDVLENRTGIDPNVQDDQGKTALHYAVNPLAYGSYENVQLLTLLVKSGADFTIKDNQGTR
jgi:ankyrin repeat protein